MENQKIEHHTEEHACDHQVLDTFHIAMIAFTLEEEMTVLWATRSFYELLKISDAGLSTLRQLYEDPLEYERLKQCINEGKEREITTCLDQEKTQWWNVSLQFIQEKHRTICQAIFHPLSEEFLMEKRRAGYFKWMLDEYGDNAYITDMDTYELLYVNRFACKTLDKTREDVIGGKCYEVIQGRNKPCPFCTNPKLKEDSFYEWDFYNPKLQHNYMIKDRKIDWEGHRARLELTYGSYSLEYKLAKKERERDAIIRTVPGGFARVDARDMRTILWYGGGFLQMIGYTKEQFDHELQGKCTYVHPDDIERASAIMQKSKDTGEDTIVEGRIITRSGEVKVLTMTYSYVSAADSWDGIESFYSVGIDITKERMEQARQKKMLEDAFQAASVANSAKTNFLSAMSHNIRTPMNAIMGMITIAKANIDTPDKVMDCLNKMDTSSYHLLHLINEVLDVSRIESGKLDLVDKEIKLSDMLQKLVDMCQPLIDASHQQLDIDTAKLIHEYVLADEDRLQQILMNLLSNAIKYSPEGSTITLRVNELYPDVPQKSQYEFVCIDHGIGISQDFLPYLFEPFSRAEDPRISKRQGTGLGMTITENLVRMMNGSIHVESTLGKGSRFTVSIPLQKWENHTSDIVCEDIHEHRGDLAGIRVLLVEDNALNREIAETLLQMKQIQVESVENGLRAVEAFTSSLPKHYDGILMDIQMPVMNGYEACEKIRTSKHEDAQSIPIIAMTADAFTTDVAKARNVGMNDHIAKPINMERLLEVLSRWIHRNKISD